MAEVTLLYNLFGRLRKYERDSISHLLQTTGELEEIVESQHPTISLVSFILRTLPPRYHVRLRDGDEENITKLFEEFVRKTRVPDFVEGDYDLVNGILAQYGKELEEKCCGKPGRRYVVDANPIDVQTKIPVEELLQGIPNDFGDIYFKGGMYHFRSSRSRGKLDSGAGRALLLLLGRIGELVNEEEMRRVTSWRDPHGSIQILSNQLSFSNDYVLKRITQDGEIYFTLQKK